MYPKLSPGYITKSTAIILSSSTFLYGFMEYITGNEVFQRKQLMPLLNCILRPELTVRFNIYLAKHRLLPLFSHSYREHSELNCNVMNMHFKNPLGLAAGFDKDAEAIKGLRESGFGFIEVGTVTPLPQKDAHNSVVKLLFKDEGYLSCGKFKSAGLSIVYLFVKRAYDRNADVPLGVNIGRNAGFTELKVDYSLGAYYFGRFSNYLVVNLGSQNGSETIADMEIALQGVTSAVYPIVQTNGPPPKILIKIPPDLSIIDLKKVIKIVLNKRYNVDGIIISNSTTNHPKNLQSVLLEDGFLSGRPLRDISTNCIRNVYSLSHGKIPIIGCGGISTGQDAYEKIRAGASLVQLYSSLLYQGFPVIGRIKRELVECLARDGFRNISEAVGADHRK
ncbi:Dihydroorotate dehydrogenase, mitochondrial precursor, putative [Brugia malayi]|uniref:Dihydroorotate dehydrogenase (quinone), mitochondrial n=2 Tax=Brugia TaxID=6278 RepID=A0A4E9FKF8_BRUMA|nr:Dihydroorotate dehydrogenase, mitochondrial precursor, putative [Brugia malayi]VIO96819.1 Dihydroorotate dehydrogenase, mitochondrial precursor, putative [Brugia malayi]